MALRNQSRPNDIQIQGDAKNEAIGKGERKTPIFESDDAAARLKCDEVFNFITKSLLSFIVTETRSVFAEVADKNKATSVLTENGYWRVLLRHAV